MTAPFPRDRLVGMPIQTDSAPYSRPLFVTIGWNDIRGRFIRARLPLAGSASSRRVERIRDLRYSGLHAYSYTTGDSIPVGARWSGDDLGADCCVRGSVATGGIVGIYCPGPEGLVDVPRHGGSGQTGG